MKKVICAGGLLCGLIVSAFALSARVHADNGVASSGAANFGPELQQWREAYAADLMKKDGWLSLVALQWLREGDSTVGSAPDNKIKLEHLPPHLGVFHQHAGVIEFESAANEADPALDGKAVRSGTLQPDDSAHPSALSSGSVLMTVIHRGDRYYLRVKDAYAPTRLHFHGLAWYPAEPRFRVQAKWVPYSPAKTLKIMNVLGQVSDEVSPGYAEFRINGATVRLDAVQEGRELFFDFRDATSKTTTDGTGRFMNTDLPDHGISAPGIVVLDFNYAHNPPCGYTNFATCPVPPVQNRLQVAIPAGEKRYPGA